MFRKLYQLLFLLTLIIAGLLSYPYSLKAENVPPSAEKGSLDFDMPLSYIDRQQEERPEGPADNRVDYTYQDNNYYSQPQTPVPVEQQIKNFQRTEAYVQQQKADHKEKQTQAMNDIDGVMAEFQQYKQAYDESRQSYSYDNYPQPYYNNEEQFSTQVYPNPLRFLDTHDCRRHTPECGRRQRQQYYGYQPYLNIFNIPGYIKNSENLYDGIDNDGDSFIDEGFAQGNVQIIFGDSGASKDDEWALYVDGKFMGQNYRAQVRNWDVNLYPGTHKVALVGVNIPDDSGTYTIVFRNASILSGPPLVGENLKQGQTLEWIIYVK